MRLLRCCLAFLVSLSTFASADLKIKTRTTVMGHSTESTVYIKGSRERTEMSYGGHGGAVSILQCDQKRMVTITGDRCMVMSMGGSESSCPSMPSMKDMMRGAGEDAAPPRKGGVVTITRTANDTGERQEMFGYKARHIKSTMAMESSPEACNQQHMKMEIDGWYADIPNFSCADESYRALACGGMGGKRGCTDRIVVKGGGGPNGYPLKQTMTMTTEQGNFTTSTEVVELTNTTLDAPLFEMPPGCKVEDMSAMMGGAPASASEAAPAGTASKPPATPPPPPAAAAAPAAPPKAAGAIRVGVVPLKDSTGQSIPLTSLQLNLLNEFGHHQIDAVQLPSDGTPAEVESEARSQQCDYFVYTVPTQLKDPGTGGIPAASLPKGVTMDPAKYQALTLMTLYKVGKPVPELKDVALTGEATKFGVDAVSATFVQVSDRVAAQIAADAHPKPATKAPATHAKPAATKPKQ
jgi:hypothetical protein